MAKKHPIALSEVIRIMKLPDAKFSIRFVTLDHKRKNKPSRHIYYKVAEECGAAHSLIRHAQVGVRPLDGSASHQVAVHLRLITHFNGHLVV
jgi:hypothetical protein